MKKQIVIIHGGHPFDARKDFLSSLKEKQVGIDDFKPRHGWKEDLERGLGDSFELFYPKMPNKETAKYEEWKVWFEKLVPFLEDDVSLVGHSLGGLFLMKYLDENVFPKKIKALILIAAPFNGRDDKHVNKQNFFITTDLSKAAGQVDAIYLFHSEDDKIVPFSDFEIYKRKLPNARAFAFTDKGHFNVEIFSELKEVLKSLYS